MTMTNKSIKNDKLYVRELISKIDSNLIKKPQYQRKRKWDIIPKKENNPNEKSYIEFLFKKKNSVHAITFGQETLDRKLVYSNIDGNVNTMERKIETDNDKTNIWEKKNDKITEKTIHHSDKKQQVDIEPKIELSELKPLHSFELPYLLESNPFNDFFYSPNIFNK